MVCSQGLVLSPSSFCLYFQSAGTPGVWCHGQLPQACPRPLFLNSTPPFSIFLLSLLPSKLLLPQSPGTVSIGGKDSVQSFHNKVIKSYSVFPHGDVFSSYTLWYPSDPLKAVSVPSQTALPLSGCLDTSLERLAVPGRVRLVPFPPPFLLPYTQSPA